MTKELPDKWIRKAVSEALKGLIGDSMEIPTYDMRVTNVANSDVPMHYILMSTQSNEVDKATKCEYFWDSTILLDIVTSYDLPGNPGSRRLADDILNEVKDLTNDLVFDVQSGLEVINQRQSFPNDLNTLTSRESIFRKLMRLELKIK